MNERKEPKLLEVDFIQYASYRWYEFIEDAMFCDLDDVCEQYDFTDETPDSDLVFKTVSDANRLSISKIYCGNEYYVTRNFLGDIAIYKQVKEGDMNWTIERMNELQKKKADGESWNEDDWIDYAYIQNVNAENER